MEKTASLKTVLNEPSPVEMARFFFYAAQGREPEIREFLRQYTAFINGKDKGGMTALMWSAESGHCAVLELLLDTGADVEMRDRDGRDALACAQACNQTATMALLIAWPEKKRRRLAEQRAQWVRKELKPLKEGLTRGLPQQRPAETAGARMMNSEELENIVPPSRDEINRFTMGAVTGDRPVIESFLDNYSVFIDGKDDSGMTALMWAAMCGHLDLLELLLERGASVDVRDDTGKTVLDWARKGSPAAPEDSRARAEATVIAWYKKIEAEAAQVRMRVQWRKEELRPLREGLPRPLRYKGPLRIPRLP